MACKKRRAAPRTRRFPPFNPNGMVRTVGNVAIGAMGIGAITTLGIGAMSAFKK